MLTWWAVGTWAATAAGGLLMAGLFLRHNGMSQSESEGIGPLRVFPHVGFAVVGLVFWVIYAITDNDTTGWVAVAGIGGAFLIAGTFLITRDQHRRRELARVEAGPGAAAGVRADAAAGRRVPAFDKCEVLIYVPLRTVNRWLRREGQENAMTLLFGTDEWAQAVAIEDGQQRIRFLHDLFYRQLKADCGLEYVRSFEIVTAARNSGYHLFFGTNHKLGLQKMKELMWDVDPVHGRRFKDSTKLNLPVLFEPEPDLFQLQAALKSRFGKEPFSIDDAEDFTLIDTPYLPSHLRKPILKPLEADRKLEIVKAKANRKRGTFPAGTVVRFL